MYSIQKVTDDIVFVGASDRRLALFENIFPLPRGVSYNSYLLLDEKTVLLDTVDKAVGEQFFENLTYALDGRPLDYLVVNHMEPDHCGTMVELVLRYPDVQIVGNSKILSMIKQFFDLDIDSRYHCVQENDTLSTGQHELTFVMAPMVHWPEVMVTYDKKDKLLFSADAFGTFGALAGNIFADEVDFEREWLADARRYYSNIVGKYGVQVAALLKKAATLDIAMICPLHGPIWRKDIGWFIDKYQQWANYIPEENAVMIAYGSIYGHTENAANILANYLAEQGVSRIAMYDVANTHPGQIVSEAFRCSHLVFASATYNNEIFTPMETALLDLKAHNIQKRTLSFIENGSWAPRSGQLMQDMLGSLKEMRIIEPKITLKSAVKEEQRQELFQLAGLIAAELK